MTCDFCGELIDKVNGLEEENEKLKSNMSSLEFLKKQIKIIKIENDERNRLRGLMKKLGDFIEDGTIKTRTKS